MKPKTFREIQRFGKCQSDLNSLSSTRYTEFGFGFSIANGTSFSKFNHRRKNQNEQ
jgi:hypothetical protein